MFLLITILASITHSMGFWIGWVMLAIIVIGLAVFVLPWLQCIRVSDAQSLLYTGAILVDVRSPAEFLARAAKGSVNIPFDEFKVKIHELDWPKDKIIIVYCAGGARSALAFRQLRALGFTNVFNLGTVFHAIEAANAHQERKP